MPHARFQKALELAGIPLASQGRRALRSLIHAAAGAPPPDHCSADQLAEMVLLLQTRGQLKAR